MKIDKALGSKIILLILNIVFLCSSTLYSYTLPKATLRVPLQGYNADAIVKFLEKDKSFSIDDIEEADIELVGKKNVNNIGVTTQEVRYKNRSYFAKWIEGDYKNPIIKGAYKRFIFPRVKHLTHLRMQGVKNIPKIIAVVKDKEGRIMILTENLRELDDPTIGEKGESLADKIEKGALSPHEALDIIFKLGRIVTSLYYKGYIHWDIKPHNIWITNTGEAILRDFGIAFSTKEEFIERICYRMGTEPYMSMKRWEWYHYNNYDENKEEFPPISEEVYSLAMTLLHMVVGIEDTAFFSSGQYADKQLDLLRREYQILEEQIDLLRMLKQPLDATTNRIEELKKLYDILHKALSNGRSDYKTIEAFMQDLRDKFNMTGGDL